MAEESKQDLVAGVDLGATHMQIGVVDNNNKILDRSRHPTNANEGVESVITRLVSGIEESCNAIGIDVSKLEAVGIAAAGAIDISRGVVLASPNLQWIDVPLRDLVHERIKRPVVVDNDVNGAAWGEYCYGAGKGANDLLGVWVGTGVGGGLVLNKRLYHGTCFTAGEIGETVIDIHGESGQRTVEDLCSRIGICRTVQHQMNMNPDFSEIIYAYQNHDEAIVEIINRSARLLGIAIANWVTMLSLDTVVIGGGVTESLAKPYMEVIHKSFQQDVFPERCRDCRLEMTELKADAGLVGAALLAREKAT